MRKLSRRYIVFYIISGLVILVLLYFVVTELNRDQIMGSLENVQSIKAADIPTSKDLQEVNKLIDLSSDESQVIYFGKIKDLNTLKGKADFFKKAKKGDILIVYPDMSIIYDPVNKVVVDIAKTSLLK